MNVPAPPAQRQRALTDAEITKTAETLLRGTKAIPSDRLVLETLGRGSLSTVNKVMRQWRQEAASKLLDLAGPDLPEEVADAAREIWIRAVAAARREAESALAADRAKLDSDRVAFETEAQDLRQRNAGLQTAYDLEAKATKELKAELVLMREAGEELGRQVASLDVNLQLERSTSAAEAAKRGQAESRLAEAGAALADAKVKAEADINRLTHAHEAEVRLLVQRIEDQRTRAERSEGAATKAAQRAEERESNLKGRITVLEARQGELEQALAARQQEYASALDQLRQTSEKALQALRTEAEAARTEAATWKARAEERGTTQRAAVPGPARLTKKKQ